MATQSVRIGWRPYVNVVTQVVNAVDADAQAFISAAGITNLTQAAAINTLVNDLKTYGLWTKMRALYPMVGGSATSHKFNLKDPRDLDAAYRLIFSGGWIHTLTGAKPNGTTGYADTFLNNNVLGQDNLSFSVYLGSDNTNSPNASCTIGSYLGRWGSGIYPGTSTGNVTFFLNGGSNTYANDNTTRGMYMASKTTSFSFTHVRGVKADKSFTTSTPVTSSFKISKAGDWPGDYNPQEQRFIHIGDGLTDVEATNFYNSVQKFNSTLGRQIGSPFVSDTDAQTFLNVAGITDLGQANAVNTLVVDLKAAGVWTKMKALYPFVGGTATTHKFNLKDPRDVDAAYRLTFVGGWTHTGAGALSNGTTGYANTFFGAGENITTSNGYFGYYTNTTTDGSVIRVSNMASIETSIYQGSGVIGYQVWPYSNITYTTSYPGLNMAGRFISNSVSGSKLYKNGVLVSTQYPSFGNIGVNKYFYLAARNTNNSGADGFFAVNLQFVFMSNTLTDSESSVFYTAVQKFQTSLGRQSGTPVLESGQTAKLLETYPSATAAYSLRKLRAGYNGYAIRVRRSSDNTEQDIAFDTNGGLDTTSLLAFVGTGNGFVTTWYDQSGNGYGVSHITASQQPEIVVSGSLITNLGKVSIRFGLVSGGVTYLQNSSLSLNTPDITIIYLGNKINSGNSLNAYSTPVALRTPSTQDWNNINNIGTRMVNPYVVANGNIGLQYNSTLYSQTYSFNTSYLMWNQKINNNFSVGKNGNTLSTTMVATSANITSNLLILGGTIFNGDSYLNGYLSEVIIYASNQSSNRTGIESNINSYYSIY